MEYIGIIVGIILFLLGIKMMDVGGLKSEEESSDSQAMYQQPYHSRINYSKRSEPNNWTYFFGKVFTVIGSVTVLVMILFLTGIF